MEDNPDNKQAAEQIKDLLAAGKTLRAMTDGSTRRAFLYAYGNRPGPVSIYYNRMTGQLVQRTVKAPASDASARRIRMSMNIVWADIRTQRSQFGIPDNLPFDAEPATTDPKDYNAAVVASRILPGLMRMARLRQKWKDASDARFVLGDAMIHLQRRVIGRGWPVLDDEGNAVVDDAGQPEMMPAAYVDASTVWPHQVTVDPAVRSHRIADHDFFIVSSPMTIGEVNDCYGAKFTKNDPQRVEWKTLGELANSQHLLEFLTEAQVAPFGAESTSPALIVHVGYWRDPETPWLWSRMAVYSEQVKTAHGMLYNGVAPLRGRPLFKLDYEPIPGQFHSRGIPDLKAQAQDLFTVCTSAAGLHVAHNSAAKPLVEEGTLAGEGSQQALLSDVPGQPVFWRRRDPNTQPPSYLNPPQMPPAIGAMMALAREIGDLATGTGAIQRGELQTHQSGDAIMTQGRRSDAILDEILRRDHGELCELLESMLDGSGWIMPPGQLSELAGGEINAQQIRDFKSACMAGRRLDVVVAQSDLVVMNQRQRQDLVFLLAKNGAVQNPDVMRLFADFVGVQLDETDRLARSYAIDENRKLAAGIPVEPAGLWQRHRVHVQQHQRALNSPGSVERMGRGAGRLLEHINSHFAAEAQEQVSKQVQQQAAINNLLGQDPLAGVGQMQAQATGNPTGPQASGPPSPGQDEAGPGASGEGTPAANSDGEMGIPPQGMPPEPAELAAAPTGY